jgi:S-adenosylmethionine synthetase
MSYLFTSESVSEGHPDKVADQISDAVLDHLIAADKDSKVAVETLVTTGLTVISGEVTTSAYIDVQKVARKTIETIGYTEGDYMFDAHSCGVLSALHEQSPDINRGLERGDEMEQGAGDQGMMFGYATRETENLMPLALDLAHLLLIELAQIRREKQRMTYLRPDAKSQVTIEYGDDNQPVRVHTIVLSTQHDEFAGDNEMLQTIARDVKEILIPQVLGKLPENIRKFFDDDIIYHVNPTGKFVIGGPHGDTGLTGRKIIVDTYGGKGAHGGGAFSGKDPSKVDRSAAYATRHIAKNLVAAGIADEILVQVSYAIGVARPMSINVNTFGTSKTGLSDSEIGLKTRELFDMRPAAIIKRLKLKEPIYSDTAAYGHMGRTPEIKEVSFQVNGTTVTRTVETFTWEKLDYVDKIKKEFGL